MMETEARRLRGALESLEAIWAYDSGATDSGVHDETLRVHALAVLHEADPWTKVEARRVLSEWLRDAYLTDDALDQGYGWEDALEFLKHVNGDA